MSSIALQPVLAQLTPQEKLQLVGAVWDELAAGGMDFPLSPAQQAQLRAEREAIRRDPGEGEPSSGAY